MAPRAAGGAFDAFVSNPDVNDYPLEDITVPTLLLHAQDDPLTSYAAAERAAGRISGARFVSLPSGGHLLIGQDDVVGQACRLWPLGRADHDIGLGRKRPRRW